MYGYDVEEFNGTKDNGQNLYHDEQSLKSAGFLSKVFGYAAIALLITTVLAIGLGLLFSYTIFMMESEAALLAFFALVISSAIGVIVTGFVIHLVSFRNKSILIPGILYSVFMGIMLSSFVMFVPWYILGMAFGITTLAFVLMFMIAKITKKSFNGLGICGIALLFGSLIIGAVFGILALFISNGSLQLEWMWYWIYLGINLVALLGIIFITMWDIAHIVQISEKGQESKNLALYCAYMIYADFIYMLLRLIRILLIIFGNRK